MLENNQTTRAIKTERVNDFETLYFLD